MNEQRNVIGDALDLAHTDEAVFVFVHNGKERGDATFMASSLQRQVLWKRR
jgi:hypothetical protein